MSLGTVFLATCTIISPATKKKKAKKQKAK